MSTIGFALLGAVVPASAASAATAATVAMAVTVGADGHGPFTPADEPGGDANDHNGIVRTNDSIVYEVTVNVTGGTAANETFTLQAPTNTTWSRLPSDCLAGGSQISDSTLTCALGDLTNATKKVSVVLAVSNAALNGDKITPTGSVSADGVAAVPSAPVAPVSVSAAPRFDLSINTVTSTFTDATGPDGTTPGHRIVYPILIDWKGLVDGDGLLGYERLKGDITFTDDVSKMFGRGESPAALLPFSGQPACGINTGQFTAAPGGRGGGTNSVVDSGTVSCTQSAPGQPISVKITGVDSSLSSIPTKSITGGTIAGGTKAYVVSGYISLWIPEPASVETLTAANTYSNLVAQSASGQTNYGQAGEPLANNTALRNVGTFLGVSGNERYWGIDPSTGDTIDLSGKFNRPFITPGQDLRSTAGVANRGTDDWKSSIVCNVFDNAVQTLSTVGGAFTATSSPRVTGAAEYAAKASGDYNSLRDTTCGDDDAKWFSDPSDVPGGAAAVGMVRWKLDFPGATSIQFHTYLKADERLPNYTRIRSFTSIQPGSSKEWVHDSSTGAQANGSWADFLTATSDLARVTLKVIDEGFTAATTPDKTEYVEQGSEITFALYPTLTNATPDGDTSTVTVRNVIPVGTTYRPGSASPAPTTVSDETDADGHTRQVLTWVLPDQKPNAHLPTLTFTVLTSTNSPAGSAVNHATISSTRDISDESLRTADRGVYVLAVGAVDVVEEAKRSGVVLGDDLEWVLRYTNNAASPFDSTDLITVLPFVGDGRGTTAAVTLKQPVAVHASESALYTTAPPTRIDVDAADASNAPGGSTRWCAAASFGSGGCPSALVDVTGVRIVHSATVTVGTTIEHTLVGSSPGAHDADIAASSFGLRVQNLSLPVSSNDAAIDIHAGFIGDRAWFDSNSDGLQDDDEPGLSHIAVRLTGSDDRGHSVASTTTTDDQGHYLFADLRPGDYVVGFGSADGGWTRQHVGDDPTIDSDVDKNGDATATLAAATSGAAVTGVTHDTSVDAGALPKIDPSLPPIVIPPDHGDNGSVRPPGEGGTAANAPHRLAFTGSTVGLWAAGAAMIAILAGLVAVTLSRRRRRRI